MIQKTSQDLHAQVRELQTELEQLKVHNQAVWALLVQIGNRLQRSSTSIKTAVSSLLDFDIFWDEATQYEFLQDIDRSTDELTDLIVLITLTFRSQAKTLEIETEPNIIQEILVTLRNNFSNNYPDIQLVTNYQPEGEPVLVDFQYLSVALTLLIETIISEDKETNQLTLQAVENSETKSWLLQISDFNLSLIKIMRYFFEQSNDISTIVKQIRPENALKLMTAFRILHLQAIKLCSNNYVVTPNTLCLIIPMALDHT